MTTFIPRPYQRLITNRILSQKRTAIWSFMGSGKTAATLEAIACLKLFDDSPVLIVAPLLVAETVWKDEAQKWEGFRDLRVSTITGGLSKRIRALKTPADIYTINFEQLPWVCEQFKDSWPFKTVVVDEASKLKNFRGSEQISKTGKAFVRSGGTQRASALAKIAHYKVERFIELTGTPSPNGLKTLWGQLWFIDRGERLGRTFDSFSQRWFKLGWDGYSIEPLPHAETEIRQRVSDVTFALVAKDWFDVKAPVVTNVFVDLPPAARKLYNDMEHEMYAEINKQGVEAVNAAVKYGKCSQMANGAVYVDETGTKTEVIHDAKLKALDRVIEEAAGMPILVAYQYKHDLARLKKAFPQGKALDGKPQTVKAWNKGNIPIMFLHPASAGHGNNFQDGGNIIVFFGLDWDLELYMQVLERIGPVRQLQSGYDRPVFVYHILARDTIDELKLKRLETKREVQDLLLEEASRRKDRDTSEA